MTPTKLCQRNDFTRNLLNVPDIEEADVKKYLLNSNVISSDSARTYKISRPYQLKQLVHSVRFSECPELQTFSVIFALCNPFQSTNADDVKAVFAVIDKITGVPYGGYCTCTVGVSLTCGHIGATLFRVSEIIASGIKEDSRQSCTDVLCQWTDPKGASANPPIFDELKISSKDRTIKRTTGDFGKRIANPSPPTYDTVLDLKASLLAATHHLGQYCPAVQVLNAKRFAPEPHPPPPVLSTLPERISDDRPDIVFSHEVSIKALPLPISCLPHRYEGIDLQHHVDKFQSSIVYTKQERDTVETITRGQSSNLEWYQQRKGAISASKLGRVLRVAEKQTKCDSLIKDIVGYRVPKDSIPKTTVPALKWGIVNETKAKSFYLSKFQAFHTNLKQEEKGLVVHDEYHYIRASPDRILHCRCHPDRLIEVKCPYSAREMTKEEAMLSGKVSYLETVNGRLQLKRRSSEGYYEQVQGLMAVLNLSMCHFVIWTKVDLKVLQVPYEKDF